jgi:hypothetical protein
VNQAFADKPTIMRVWLSWPCCSKPTAPGAGRRILQRRQPDPRWRNPFRGAGAAESGRQAEAALVHPVLAHSGHSGKDVPQPARPQKVCIIDEAWRLLGGSNPHAARFIETGYRTVRRHRGAFITITQGIKDFSASKEAEAAWNNSSTKITLLQDAKAFKQYLADNPDQFSDMEKEVIRGFQPALQTGYSSLLISAGEFSSFHRLFVDPVTRAMFSSRGEDFAYMQNAQKAGASAEEAAICWPRRNSVTNFVNLKNG